MIAGADVNTDTSTVRANAAPADPSKLVVFDNVSKFYGETLGVNRVHLALPPGITSLVGPNGAGKSTFMGLMTGILQPTAGTISVLGISPRDPEALFRHVGFCTQHDAFPKGLTGYALVYSFLLLHGHGRAWADEKARRAIDRVGMTNASDRKVAAYSKGMRQRIKLAQAICHEPSVLVLDEPLNGLDPMARAEAIALFRELAAGGRHVIISSHILHEVDLISDRVVLLNEGYVIAEGEIRAVRNEMKEHPLQIEIRCDRPSELASQMLAADSVVEVKIARDKRGLLIRTTDADRFYRGLNRVVIDNGVTIERIAPADDDVQAVYDYLIGSSQGGVR